MARCDLENRVRQICSALPGVTEKRRRGTPRFFVGQPFVMLWPQGQLQRSFPQLWAAAPTGVQEGFLAFDPDHFFRPPFVGDRGWVGVRLDIELDWVEIEVICEEAYRAVAPRHLRQVFEDFLA